MKSVLIVEDYESIKNLYEDAFLRAGFSVDTAPSGSAGLEKTKEKEYDLIILDILMLKMSGIDFLEGFDAAKHPSTKIVVISNLDSPNIVEKAKLLGASDYLIKSQYTPKELVEYVTDAYNKLT